MAGLCVAQLFCLEFAGIFSPPRPLVPRRSRDSAGACRNHAGARVGSLYQDEKVSAMSGAAIHNDEVRIFIHLRTRPYYSSSRSGTLVLQVEERIPWAFLVAATAALKNLPFTI